MSVEAKLIKINDRRSGKKSADATHHGVKKHGPTYSILLRGKAGFTKLQALSLLRTIRVQPKAKGSSPSLGKHQSSLTASRFDPAQAEAFYQNLGRWKGPRAAPEVKAATEAFWLGSGHEGAAWLVQRLRTESHIDPLDAAGSFLADLGEAALGPILAALAGSPPPDQASALLKALGWMAEKPTRPPVPASAELILVHALQDDDADVRDSAARALLLIPPERAADWLKLRRLVEPNEHVRATIQEGLDLLTVGA